MKGDTRRLGYGSHEDDQKPSTLLLEKRIAGKTTRQTASILEPGA